MELLMGRAKLFGAYCPLLALVLTACMEGQPAVDIIPVETDTWISTESTEDHATDGSLYVSLEGDREERALLKIPTGKQSLEDEDRINEVLTTPLVGILLLPITMFYVIHEIFESLFDCDTSAFDADDLTTATLSLGIADDGGQALGGLIQLEILSAPWWQGATWSRAHPFSSRGRWEEAGGDIDDEVAAIPATVNDGLLEFDVTEYFRELIDADKPIHFGAVLRASGASLERVELASVQHDDFEVDNPTLTANYAGSCGSGTGMRVTRLGHKLKAPGK
jgi:hypothetical protein